MSEDLRNLLVCPRCAASLRWTEDAATCTSCAAVYPIRDGIARFVADLRHENFAIQWKRFADVQLDSRNGTTCTRDRLLDQSGLSPAQFAGLRVLEVGCGAGRFTEILLDFGALVVAVDYSEAVEVCAATHQAARREGRLLTAQADVFALPVRPRSFDMVLGYGLLQHTGDPRHALRCLWEPVQPGGLLLADRYQLSLRRTHPLKYLLRPVLKRLPPLRVLALAEAVCRVSMPFQRAILKRLPAVNAPPPPGSPAARAAAWLGRGIRYLIARSPNSTFPLMLERAGKLSPSLAWRWSVLDTFDMWAPRYDRPQTLRGWHKDLMGLAEGEVLVCRSCGQGNTGVARRRDR
jgi:2-polyprenyl-3-methyl-5-hydroxy-6-metoxy-1,4-benzoquinol methylase